MKQANFFKRFLCVMLSVVLMAGNVMPIHAHGTHASEDHSTDHVEIAGQSVNFTQVDNSEVSASLTPNGRTEITEEEDYADTDVVRASIILSRSSTIDAGFSPMDIASNQAAAEYRKSLKMEQANVINSIKRSIQSELDVVWNLTLVANIISVNVEYGDIETIENMPGVKAVILESQYVPYETGTGSVVPNMATSGNQIGTGPVWDAGYTGAGMRIAVIDTGIDTDHQSLNAAAFEYALAQQAAKAGKEVEAYISGLDLLDATEIANVASALNVKVDAANAYINSKIPFGYNYRDFDYDVTHDNDEQGDHGSHVSGISAANSYIPSGDSFAKALDTVFVQGVAPEAQLLTMKVFGKNGSPYDSDFFAAIEDAIVLGADAINLSLGSVAPGRAQHSNVEFRQIMDSLTKSGVVVSISAGNSGTWVENADNGGYLYSTDVSMDTLGQPGSFTNSLCVASVENDGMVGYYFTVGDEFIVYVEERFNAMDSLVELAGEQEYVFIDGVGKEEDWDALADVLPGKVAICSRGETNFVEKATLAEAAGAIALMVYNNVSGIIYLDLTSFEGTIPVVSLTQAQGATIRANSEDKGGYLTGTMNISDVAGKGEFASAYYTMSDFSSWGVTGSLELKPEITAPGGNIYSLEGLDRSGTKYALKSGTSMASPQVAGMSALMLQYIRETGLDTKTNMDARHLAQSLLMSTAEPILADKNNYYPVLQQGAGLANINNAINADSYITMAAGSSKGAADGKVKVELYDDPDRTGSYSAEFTIHNLQDVAKEFALNADFFIQSPVSDGEFMYMDTVTETAAMDVVWKVNGQTVVPAGLEGMDFNNDGIVSASDGQALLDFATGLGTPLSNKDKADVDRDGDIDSHDAYVFLRDLNGVSAALPANGSATVSVEFSMTDELRALVEECYPNGTYIQGYLFAETGSTDEGVAGTAHSIPVLGFYGNWTDSSMFDVGRWVTYATGEDTRIPYVGITRGNDFQVRYAKDSAYHYSFGGNPVIPDAKYMPERNAFNNNDAIHGVNFVAIRHADQSRVRLVNQTTKEVILNQITGPVNMAYFYSDLVGWQNNRMILETHVNMKNTTSEGDQISMEFTLVPEYYIDSNGKVDWDALDEGKVLGDGATMSTSFVIDNTAPKLEGVSVDFLNNTMTITASDNQYVAAAGIYNKTGTRCLASVGSKAEIGKGESAAYTFSLDKVNGKKFLVQVFDYAMNVSTYLLEVQIGESAGVPDMMAFDLVQWHWTTFTKDFEYSYKVGTPRLAYADFVYYAATIAEHYVFASTSEGELYVMPEDDLTDTTFIVDLGTIIYDMAYNKADGEIYAVTETNELVTINKLTGSLTKLGKIGVKTNTLACDGEGTFFCNELGTGRVYSFTLETKNDPEMLVEDPFLTSVDPITGADMGGTTGNMGMEYNPNTGMLCWNSHCEVLVGSYITFAYYYEINPETGEFTRYNDFWHEMSCLMIPDETGRSNGWAEPTEEVIGVQLNKSGVEMIKGTTAQLTANVQPWTAVDRTVTWFSADESIATVDQNGVVTAVAPGTTTITATSKLDPSKRASCQVTVDLLYVTINGTVMDRNGESMFYSWNMAEDDTWKAGDDLSMSMTSATWSTKDEAFYIMDSSEELRMFKVTPTGTIIASVPSEKNIPLWDMAYSETFSTADQEMVSSIYYSYLLSPKDPLALDAVGFDLSSMCSYLVGLTSFGSERVEDEEGNWHDTEHLVMLDNDGYIWHFWIYAREDGGYDALYAINKTDLNCAFPGDESMEHMYTSLMVGDDNNLYLSTYNGEPNGTNEIYYIAYDEEEERYVAVKVGEMGPDVWPATITSVTVNDRTKANAVHPQPEYTMSSTTFTRGELAAASVSDGSKENLFFAADEAKRNLERGMTVIEDHAVSYSENSTVFEISTADDLLEFAEKVNGGENALDGKLMADIDMAGKAWTPIGNSEKNYTGTFDGQGHTVSNLTLIDEEDGPDTSYVGLFGYVSGGTVKNVTVKDANFSVYNYAAGVVGRLASGTVENCALTGTSTITANTSSDSYVGGVVGRVDTNATVQNCYNEGTVTGGGQYVGGVVGYVNSGITLTNCYNIGTVTGKKYTAGIVSRLPYSDATVSNCYSIGTVTGETANVGAVIGNGGETISNNYYLTGSAKIGETAMNGTGNYKDTPKADTAGATDGKDAAWFATAEAVTALNNGGTAWAAGTSYPVLAVFGNSGGTTPDPEPECQHTNEANAWQSDESGHWQICDDCEKRFNEGEHNNTGSWQSDDTNHWKVCSTCGAEVYKAAHSYKDGKCECGKDEPVVECQHTNEANTWQSDESGHWQICDDCEKRFNEGEHNNTGSWQSDDTNHWKVCSTCGAEVDKDAHSYVAGKCECGKDDPDANLGVNDTLVLGANNLTSGVKYIYTARENGRLEFDFSNVVSNTGKVIYLYQYGTGLYVDILINGKRAVNLENTRVTVTRGDEITVELASVDGNSYTGTLTLSVIEAAAQLQLGDNAIAKDTDYSFIATETGTLYTTVKELWCDGAYCTEQSLTSSVVFRINGAVIENFQNSYEVTEGDEITVLLGTTFKDSASAVLNLSYEGFYTHPEGSRGNPYILNCADCPSDSVEIPGNTAVWYKLSGFGEDAYLTVEGANAYVIVGNTRVNAYNGKLTVPASLYMQVGNSGNNPATFRFSASFTEGTENNPKDLVTGSNTVTLGKSEQYFYDYVAKKPGTATVTVSGANWRFWLSHLAADGSYIVESKDHRATNGDSGTITVKLAVGESIIVKLSTYDSQRVASGGTLTVNFTFTADQSTEPCEHVPGEPVTENTIAATCTTDGSYDTVVYCSLCGNELSRVTTSVPAPGHTPGAEATCTTAQCCTTCGAVLVRALGHKFVNGECSECGQLESDNVLVLGENNLTSGNVYTYTVTEDCGLEFEVIKLQGGDGQQIYDFEYQKGLRLKIMLNGKHIPGFIKPTKINAFEGQTVTLSLDSVDGGNYTGIIELTKTDLAPMLSLNTDNAISKDVTYSFVAPQDGTLYTTIKELWYEGGYCTEASLASTVVFRINGAVISSFNNSYEVKAGDEVTVLLGTSFTGKSARAVLYLSYDGFYQHPAGSRGNPYVLAYSDCPTKTASIPAGTAVWYQLSGFGSGYYLTVTGENAYVIISGTTYNATNGSVTVPVSSNNLQIGNAGSSAAVFDLSATITVGYPDNPEDLQEGTNTAILPERGNYYYDFVAPNNGTATISISGENWGYQYTVYDADGEVVYVSGEGMSYGYKGDNGTVKQYLDADQYIVIRLGTMTSSWSQPGGEVTVTFSFKADGSCNHVREDGKWEQDETHHWQICDRCEEQFNKSLHNYGVDEKCVCGKTDPRAECEHTYGEWIDGLKTCSKCGNIVKCQHASTVLKDKVDATCTEEGYTGDQVCTQCNMVTVKGEVIPATGHSYEEGYCTACGEKDPDYRPIISKEIPCSQFTTNGVVTVSWENPDEMALVGIEIHADYSSVMEDRGSVIFGYVSIDGIAAGESVATLYFEVVDPEDADVTVVFDEFNNASDGCAHAVTEVRGKKDATCTEDGYTGDTYCTDCGKKVATGKIAPATGHYAEKTFVWAEDLSSATMVCSCGDVSAACTMAWDNSTPGVMVFTASVMVDGKLYTDTRVITSTKEGDKVTVLLPAGVSGVVIYAAAYNSANQMTDCASQYVTGSSVTLTISGDNIRLFFLNSDYCPVSDHMAA